MAFDYDVLVTGSGFGLMTTLTDGDTPYPRWVSWVGQLIRHPRQLSWFSVRRRSEKWIILLVMQARDDSITVSGRTRWGRFRLSAGKGHGEPNPTWIPAGNEATRRVAEKPDGIAGGSVGGLANIPMAAHFIGGCVIAENPDEGVIDPVAPGLRSSRAARGRRFSDFGEPRGESLAHHHRAVRAGHVIVARPRPAGPPPPVGAGYRWLASVAPASPAVPAHAPASLRVAPRVAPVHHPHDPRSQPARTDPKQGPT